MDERQAAGALLEMSAMVQDLAVEIGPQASDRGDEPGVGSNSSEAGITAGSVNP